MLNNDDDKADDSDGDVDGDGDGDAYTRWAHSQS